MHHGNCKSQNTPAKQQSSSVDSVRLLPASACTLLPPECRRTIKPTVAETTSYHGIHVLQKTPQTQSHQHRSHKDAHKHGSTGWHHLAHSAPNTIT
jgi:hypothetical protein